MNAQKSDIAVAAYVVATHEYGGTIYGIFSTKKEAVDVATWIHYGDTDVQPVEFPIWLDRKSLTTCFQYRVGDMLVIELPVSSGFLQHLCTWSTTQRARICKITVKQTVEIIMPDCSTGVASVSDTFDVAVDRLTGKCISQVCLSDRDRAMILDALNSRDGGNSIEQK